MTVLLNRKENSFLIHAQDDGGVGGSGVHLSPRMHQECPKLQQFSQNTMNIGRTPWLLRRNIQIHTELSRTKEKRDKEEGERRSRASGTSLHLGEKELKHQGEIPASMAVHWDGGCIWSSWGVNSLICHSLNRVRTTQTSHAEAFHTSDRVVSPLVSTEAGSWSHGDCRMIPGRGLLLTVGSQTDGMGLGNLLHGMLLKENYQAIKVGFHCLWSRAISFSMRVPAG